MKKKQFAGVKCPECEIDFGVPENTAEDEEFLFCPVCQAEVESDQGTEAFSGTFKRNRESPDRHTFDEDWEDDEDEGW